MKLLTPVMIPTGIPAPIFRWELAGGGIRFSIGAFLTARGIFHPITTRCLITAITPGIRDIGEATIRAMDGATIQVTEGGTIQVTDIRPTGTGKALLQKGN